MTCNNITLNEDELDCLQELMNIAYGSATACITEIIDSFATLQVPRIKIVPANKLNTYLKENFEFNTEHIVSTQLINGTFSGENLFLISTESAKNLAIEFGVEEEDIDDNELFDIILETTNILSSSTVGKLAEELHTNVSFEPPSVEKIESINTFGDVYTLEYQQIIIISSVLEFEEHKIRAELLIMTKDNSIAWLKNALNEILELY
jgi:chemotaxis protein CheC